MTEENDIYEKIIKCLILILTFLKNSSSNVTVEKKIETKLKSEMLK